MRRTVFTRMLLSALLVGASVSTATEAAPKVAANTAKPVAKAPTALDIARRVQGFYDRTKTFQATFKQTYFIKSTGTTKNSYGQVIFEKPGKMSWRYKNNGNRVVADGRIIKVYEQDSRQMFESDMGKTPYPAALSFLLGNGRLEEEFVLKLLQAKQMRFEGGWVLEAKPKEASPAYQSMILYVDGPTAQVRRVLLLDAQGNRNRFDFVRPSVNVKVKDGEFRFTPPSGTQVVRQ